ncbi:ribonuclease H [Haloglomus salinum]|jgi:ribonuclease HI|uniref:ribonuclease H n=1 Tax=Haloglomus salinum TaxID=2962673 RepID=UPI0020C9E259|nr:ribonuclease H [Haloglomus salinum]
MAAYSRPALRNLFDDSPTPHIAHPPRTHHRDYYLAADGSFRQSGEGGLGVLIETRDGRTVARLAVPDRVPDNNVAEYRALHLGLDVLAEHAESDARVGVLVDHDDLAANVNRATLASMGDRPPHPYRVPRAARHHWRGIRARVARFAELRAARINSRENPAHPLANTPEQYRGAQVRPDPDDLPGEPADLHDEPGTRDRRSEPEQVPPPSRADRHASD